jgi:predicted nucleotidyltransferase
MAYRSVVESIRLYLNELVKQGIPVEYGVLFGSRHGDSADTWSDIDLMVVSSSFDSQRKRETINTLWRVAARIDSRIEPVPVGKLQWENDDGTPLIEIARREGEKIFLD